jgi:2Fe-2S ferredoxin
LITVVYIDRAGVRHELEADPGRNLMEVAYDNAVPGILGDCGGTCSCATCHAYVAPEWFARIGPPDEIEEAMLEVAADRRDNSRLLCQVEVSEFIDGIEVEVADNR